MKAIVSVLGRDRKGIIANVSMALYKLGVNIVDISQTVMQSDYFTMIMMVELDDSHKIDDINLKLQELAVSLGVEIRIQHEDVFNSMHRI